MLKERLIPFKYSTLLTAITLGTIYTPYVRAEKDLDSINYRGASVLPLFTKNNTVYAVLSREAYGRDCGTYDSFGGSRDWFETPIGTAARECAEEMISHNTINFSITQMERYINPTMPYTKTVIVDQKRKYVLFLTHFDHYIDNFLKTFHNARTKSTQCKYQEKDSIAIIPWETLKSAVQHNHHKVRATILNSHNSNQQTTEIITLRPILMLSLDNHVNKKKHQIGTNSKVHFYN